jgi:Ca-activated chloride channel family protein
MFASLVIALLYLWRQQPAAPAGSDDVVISTDVNLVMLDVIAKNPKGGYVSGLKAEDFRVFQDDKPQKIKYFSKNEEPVTMGLVVDNSGSMQSKRPGVNVAALALVGASNPHDEIFVVNFNDKVNPGLPPGTLFSDDVPTLRKALWQGRSEGRTKLYDALNYSLQYLDKGRMDKKTLVVVSDGRDNASALSRKEVTDKVEQSHATVYGIDIYDEDDPDGNSDVLRKLSQISGGEYFQLRDVPQVLTVCTKIAEDIRHRYTISYRPSLAGAPASVHSVKVTAALPTGQKLIVRTRTRYMVPAHK